MRLTLIGEYTIKLLMLDADEWLKNHWRNLFLWQQQKEKLEQMMTRKLPSEERGAIISVIQSLEELLIPPIFDKPRRAR